MKEESKALEFPGGQQEVTAAKSGLSIARVDLTQP